MGKDLKCLKKSIVFIILNSLLTEVDYNLVLSMMNRFQLNSLEQDHLVTPP